MNTYSLPESGYSDVLLHAKEKDGVEDKKRSVFPFTRYRNVLNRPRTITNVSESPNADFHLLVTETIEVSDDVLFAMMGQTW